MGFVAKLRAEFIDIVEWVDDSRNTLVWRFPRYHNQIKNGARLIVRPGQVAVFVHMGKLADVFEPGTYTLDTRNLPILSTLQGWKYGVDSPFKAEVYFVTTRQVSELKWGTPNPVLIRDVDFGPVRVRAFGSYTLRVREARSLMTELVGTDGEFIADEINVLLRSIIGNAFADLVANAGISVLDLASNYRDLSEKLRQMVIERVDDEYGLEVPQLYIVNVSVPDEVARAVDACTSMNVIGNLTQYREYQLGQSIPTAAANPAGGLASAGVGVGMGVAIAGQMLPEAGGAPGRGPGGAGWHPAPMLTPPAAPGGVWHVAENRQAIGPFTAAQMVEAIGAGRVRRDTLVWTGGMTGWTRAGEIADLARYFPSEATPPPLPPQA
jgi:membrane protease subunit (stomatin/prohibitin family)